MAKRKMIYIYQILKNFNKKIKRLLAINIINLNGSINYKFLKS